MYFRLCINKETIDPYYCGLSSYRSASANEHLTTGDNLEGHLTPKIQLKK